MISLYETILVVSTAVVIIAYHTHLYMVFRRNPLTTAIGITNHARQMWVAGVMKDKRDILAVQTLRNQVMAATFLASTALLICLGSFSAAFRPGVFIEVSHALNLLGTKTETLWMFKLMLLGILFFATFFNFTLAIRYYNHVGFMINTFQLKRFYRFRGSCYSGSQSRRAALHHRHARVLPVGAAGPVVVRSDLVAGRQPGFSVPSYIAWIEKRKYA